MRILHLLANAFRGGCEKNCYFLIQSTPESTHEVLVMGKEGPMAGAWRELGATVKACDLLTTSLQRFSAALRTTLSDSDFDKVILWTNVRLPLVLSALNKYQATIYVHIGNPIDYHVTTSVKNMILSWLLPVHNKVYLRPVSRFVQKSLESERYYRRFPSKVSLKPVVVPGERSPLPRAITPDAPPLLGMVARLDRVKDHDTVLKAFARILAVYPGAVLHLGGGGSLLQELTDLATELGIHDQVVFHGDVANVYGLMQHWDLFLYATTWQEGLGGTVPEALSVGLPVIATDLPMIREWDQEARFIVYCQPFDPLDMAEKALNLLGDVKQRQLINEGAREYITAKFSPAVFTTNYLSD